MKKKSLNIILVSSVFISLIVFLVYYNACKSQYKYLYKYVDNDPLNTLIYTLNNGLTVYMSINKDEPRIQTNIAVNTGSKQDPSDATGLAHYLEHMLFKGTDELGTINWEEESKELKKISDLYEELRSVVDQEKRDLIYHQIDSVSGEAAKYAVANEYDKMISSLGAKGTNAYTSLERTVYINDIPSNELEKWLSIESERFSQLVLRLFHTELETVYEEFNRSQDNDARLSWYTLMANLFKKHPYGTQTTIGTSEHLKNPSMEKIHQYFDTYYVPNNMAIILSGDIDPDKTVELIEKYFGDFEYKEVPSFQSPNEAPIMSPEIIDVNGSDSEWVDIGFRLEGVDSTDTYLLPLLDGLLSNGKAGLIDLNLIKSQKILSGYSSYMIAKDYSVFYLHGEPREGQSLDDARELLLQELEKIKAGKFEEWMLSAVIKNNKLNDQRRNEYNSYRAYKMTDAFILDQDLHTIVNKNNKLSTVDKNQIIEFANKYFNNNYIVVNKNNGNSSSIKVEKPSITTVPLNRDTSSVFAERFYNISSVRLEPVFNDYKNDIDTFLLNRGISGYYVENTTNEVFSLSYVYEIGRLSDKYLGLAVNYLEYLGTDKYSAVQIEEELFKLGLSYNVSVSDERIYVQLSGLEESFEQGIELFEHVLSNAEYNIEAYDNMVKDIIRKRQDNKLSKRMIKSGMINYAKYGSESPFTSILSEEELIAIDPNNLVNKLKELKSYNHLVYYYGRKNIDEIKRIINNHHIILEPVKNMPTTTFFTELENLDNKVYFMHYDMVQSEITMISKSDDYNQELIAPAKLFNEYFGSGLSSIVFQEIRESKALAYSAYSYFSTPSDLDKSHYVVAYLGTQVDKLNDATSALLSLMNKMPKSESQFNDAKTAALKQIETSRTKRSQLFWRFLASKKMGQNYDINQDLYAEIEVLTIDDLNQFFNKKIKNKNYSFVVIGNQELIDHNLLKSMGEYKQLTDQEVFGY